MTSTRVVLLVAAVCLLGVVGIATAGAGDAAPSALETQTATMVTGETSPEVGTTGVSQSLADTHVGECAATPQGEDPDGGTDSVIGWVDGYWYNDTLDIDGPTIEEDELDSFVARTAARVEAFRCHAFEEVPPTQILTRDEYRQTIEPRFDEIPADDWRFEDARLATLLVAGQEVDARELQTAVQTAFPAAFYNTEEEFMGFITDDPDTIEINQVTLAHELTHALQDQQFDLERIFDEPTNDQFIAALAIAEGDATTVDTMYEENCEHGIWADECIIPPPGDDPDIPNWGLILNQLAAYHTPLVAETAETEGFGGVDALLEDYPDSMVEAIYPDRYGEFERADITIPDRSSGDWERLVTADEDGGEQEAYDIIGQHGLTAILAAPSFETGGVVNVIDPAEFQQPHAGGFLTYSVTETSGWQADRLYGYTNDAGDNASVWKLAWEDTDEAERFADAYEELIDYRNGALADGYENVFTFEDADEYDMAVGLEHDGDRVWIVTAPTVDDLTAVHEDIELRTADDDPENGDAENGDAENGDADETDDEEADDEVDDGVGDVADEGEDEDGAALGLVHAAVGLVAVIALALVLSVFPRRGQRR